MGFQVSLGRTVFHFLLFRRNTTTIRPFIIRVASIVLLLFLALAVIEIVVLILGAYHIVPAESFTEGLLSLKQKIFGFFHGS